MFKARYNRANAPEWVGVSEDWAVAGGGPCVVPLSGLGGSPRRRGSAEA
jgi:hypothetical protein